MNINTEQLRGSYLYIGYLSITICILYVLNLTLQLRRVQTKS